MDTKNSRVRKVPLEGEVGLDKFQSRFNKSALIYGGFAAKGEENLAMAIVSVHPENEIIFDRSKLPTRLIKFEVAAELIEIVNVLN